MKHFKSNNHLGSLSLITVSLGFILLAILFRFKIISGVYWQIILYGFEAGTVGAIADWFAVTALFREVPIPILKRHTNIIINNRERITESIVDMVENKWLTTEMLVEKCNKLSITNLICDLLKEEPKKQVLLSIIRDLIEKIINSINENDINKLEDILIKKTKEIKFEKHLGVWLEKNLDEKKFDVLLNIVFRELLEDDNLKKLINNYDDGMVKDSIKKVILFFTFPMIKKYIKDALDNPDHELRKSIYQKLYEISESLKNEKPEYMDYIAKFKESFLSSTQFKGIINNLLTDMKYNLYAQSKDNNSELIIHISLLLDKLIAEIRNNETLCKNIDKRFCDISVELITKYHSLIGNIVRSSLSSEKLNDVELVNQIESKVGHDLQYIRLNGAIVGSLVGMILCMIKLFIL
jgi:uncharacterized membrane-anchored protein YjiN (DUF445 family)